MSNAVTSAIFEADTVNAIAAVANVAVALLALLVAAVSIRLSRQALAHQQQHNRLSVRPIPYLLQGNFSNKLEVAIKNNGSGPLILEGFRAFDDHTVKDDLISWMPKPDSENRWRHFSTLIKGRSVLPGDNLIMIQLIGSVDDPKFLEYRNLCRANLASLIIEVDFTDIYGTKFPPHRTNLRWFGRPQLEVFK